MIWHIYIYIYIYIYIFLLNTLSGGKICLVVPWATKTVLSPRLVADVGRVSHMLSHVAWWKKKYIYIWGQSENFKIIASYMLRYKYCNTDGRSVWTTSGTMLKNIPPLVTFHKSILVSQWTFQPTHAHIYIYIYIHTKKR